MQVKKTIKLIHWLKRIHQETEETIASGAIMESAELGDECFRCLDEKLECIEDLVDLLESGNVVY